MIWPFRRRRRQPNLLDCTGPATCYPQQAGAHPPPPRDRPARDPSTPDANPLPIVTRGQMLRGYGAGRPALGGGQLLRGPR